jgi:hypothetical protein
MPSTITIQNVINWATPFLKNTPIAVSNSEPALTTANLVLQTILSAPFRWRWNRGTFEFNTILTLAPPTTDYTISIPDFGFLEECWMTDSNSTPYPPMQPKLSLPQDLNLSRPQEIAAQYDDDAGNITFRLKNAPDAVYTIQGNYQRKPVILPSLGYTFGPVPDEFAFVYNWGYLCVTSLLVNDARFPIFERFFIGRLLGLQDGLDDVQRNIFLLNWEALTRSVQRNANLEKIGTQGRAT